MEGGEGYFEACRDRVAREIPEADVIHPLKRPVWGAIELVLGEENWAIDQQAEGFHYDHG